MTINCILRCCLMLMMFCTLGGCYSTNKYKGDGRIEKVASLLYVSSYSITMPPLALRGNGAIEYVSEHPPPGELLLWLRFAPTEREAFIDSLPLVLEVAVTSNRDGRIVSHRIEFERSEDFLRGIDSTPTGDAEKIDLARLTLESSHIYTIRLEWTATEQPEGAAPVVQLQWYGPLIGSL